MRIRGLFRTHYLAIIFALLTGALTIAPYLLTIHALGSDYRGMPPMYADNEDYYIARTHEIFDGHFSVASPFYYEYKNILPVVPPVGEYLFAGIKLVSGLSLPAAVIAAKFLLPAVLFLLIYGFVRLLLRERVEIAPLTALAAASLVVLALGLVDYAGAISRLVHGYSDVAVTLWARPVNPVTGALLLFLLLIHIFKMREYGYVFAATGGLALAAMAGYVFSFTAGFGVLGALFLIALFFKQWKLCLRYAVTGGVALALVATYALAVLPYLKGGGGLEKSGFLVGHMPIFNKVALLAALALAVLFFIARRTGTDLMNEENNHGFWFSFALVFGCLLAFNQQLITGAAIWPPHLAQYSNPLVFIGVFAAAALVLSPLYPLLWRGVAYFTLAVSLLFALWNVTTYQNGITETRNAQSYIPVLSWLEHNAPKECVVVIAEDERARFANLIPGFTECNVYSISHITAAYPDERILHNYLVELRLRGVKGKDIDTYLAGHTDELLTRFYKDWNELFNEKDPPRIRALIPSVAGGYKEFLQHDFLSEVKEYKSDYLVDGGLLDTSVLPSLSAKKIFEGGGFTLYSLPQ